MAATQAESANEKRILPNVDSLPQISTKTRVTLTLIAVSAAVSLVGLLMTLSRDRALSVAMLAIILLLLGAMVIAGVGTTPIDSQERSDGGEQTRDGA